jgi:hypothetical protein
MATAQRRLTEQERRNILDRVVKEELKKVVATEGSYGGGSIFIRNWHPTVYKRGTTWAQVAHRMWVWHPAIIFIYSIFSFISCGLWSWYWLYATFKKPRIYTVTVDEYGNDNWTQMEIPQVQKVERYILIGAMVLWALVVFRTLDALQWGRMAG